MLWKVIGIWLACGAVLPVFWLLSIAYRWVTSLVAKWAFSLPRHHPSGTRVTTTARHIEPDVLYGLVIVGTLVLLFGSWFADLPSASAVAQAPGTQQAVAEARPIQSLGSATLSHSPAQLSAKPTQ